MNTPEEKMKARQSLKVIALAAPLALGILGGVLGGYLYHSVNDKLDTGNTPAAAVTDQHDQPGQPPERGAEAPARESGA